LRKTKIICTIGSVTDSYEMIERLYHSGMDVVRLNMSHGNHDTHRGIIRAVRELNSKILQPIPILLDTRGPEIRTGELSKTLELDTGSEISVVATGAEDVETTSIRVDYANLMDSVEVGDRVTVDSGMINLEVLQKEKGKMRCRVIDGGHLQGKRHVNLPGIRIDLPAITEKDRADILFGLEEQIDYVALSFARQAKDIDQLKNLLGEQTDKVKIIAKIEDQEGVENVEELIDGADGIMIARGDLGVEVNFAELPNIQRRIVRLCAEGGKRVIVATHLLESMIQNPMPTRAEITDVANAVYEEADAVMLSGETAIGRYPVRCVEHLSRICLAAEGRPGLNFSRNLRLSGVKQSLALSATHLAQSISARGIVVITRRGRMADYVTNCHPASVPVYAFSNDSRTRRRLALNRGLRAFYSEFGETSEETLTAALSELCEQEEVQPSDRVVVVSDVLEASGAEAIQIRRIGDIVAVRENDTSAP